jgi:hypothetical protein
VCVSRLSCLFVSSAEVELLLNAKVHVTSGTIRTRQEEHYSWPSLQKDCSPRESPSDVTSVRAAVAVVAAATTNNCYPWRRTAS